MKFAMNGALTIGTLDGVNIEDQGCGRARELLLVRSDGARVVAAKNAGYHPWSIYESNPVLREVIDSLTDGQFSRGDRDLFRPLVDGLLNSDPYLLFADYQSYVDTQDQISATFLDQEKWSKMSIYNAARMGKFSSDRAIQEYCKNIWAVSGLPGM
jgi:starch phosphorylase